MDTKTINELISVLELETKVYDDILRISRDKTDIIVQGKVTELEKIVKLEQALVIQIGRLEDKREELVAVLSEQLNMKPSDITITELLKYIKSDQAEELRKCQGNISRLVNDMRSANDLNSKLIKNSLEYIDFSINLLAGVGPAGNNYGNSGQLGDSKKRNFFDVKL